MAVLDVDRCEIGGNGIFVPCNLTPQAGTGDLAVLLDFYKIQKPLTKSVERDNVLTDLVRRFGGEGVAVQGRENSIKGQSTSEQGTYLVSKTHVFSFVSFGDDPVQAYIQDLLENSTLVSVWRSANGWWRVSGLDNGMIITANNFDTDDEDSGGGTTTEMTGTKETKKPYFLASGYGETTGLDGRISKSYDEGATLAIVEGLVEPVTLAISDISIAAEPVVTVTSTEGMRTGKAVTFKNITWGTDPTDPTATLNDKNFLIEVIDGTTFKVVAAENGTDTFDTSGGTYGSGGTVQRYFTGS